MKELIISIENSKLPKYQSLAESIRLSIRQGRVRPGEGLPSTRELARKFKMDRHTVMNALHELTSEGWIFAKEKKGYFVNPSLPDTYLRAKKIVGESILARKVNYNFARRSDVADYSGAVKFKHSFPSGLPDVRHFPMREFKSHLLDAFMSKDVLGYSDPVGHDLLRSEIQTYVRRVRSVQDRSIIVTNGSQEAIFLLAQLLIRPGDVVAVEEFGYRPAFEALRFAGAKLLPIRLDQEGMDVVDLEKKIRRHKIKLIYTTPLHQYPTTVTLSASRRLKLYELCVRNNILILEDDYDHEFHYVSQPVAPLASFDPAGLVMYVSTFSKVLFPSARVGFMAVPDEVAREMAKLKRISSRQNELILQVAIANWMGDGGFERHLRRMRRLYDERRFEMVRSLEKLRERHQRLRWLEPDGGMALWLDIRQDAKALAEKARRHAIGLNSGNVFHVEGKHSQHLRLGFSGQTPQENHAGLFALAALL